MRESMPAACTRGSAKVAGVGGGGGFGMSGGFFAASRIPAPAEPSAAAVAILVQTDVPAAAPSAAPAAAPPSVAPSGTAGVTATVAGIAPAAVSNTGAAAPRVPAAAPPPASRPDTPDAAQLAADPIALASPAAALIRTPTPTFLLRRNRAVTQNFTVG